MICRPVLLLVAVSVPPLLGAHPARAEGPASSPTPAAPARQLTIAAAIEVALSHNPQLAIEAENLVVAESKAAADSKLRLPLVGVKANVLFWDRPIVANLGPEIGEITIRDRVTGSVDFSVAQRAAATELGVPVATSARTVRALVCREPQR